MNDQAIEQEIQAKGLTAPRITPADIEANIAGEFYFTAGDGVVSALMTCKSEGWEYPHVGGCVDDFPSLDLLTFCVLILRNGYTVHGTSACASPENFDAEIGRKIARQKAIDQVGPLMGYELRSKLDKVDGAA